MYIDPKEARDLVSSAISVEPLTDASFLFKLADGRELIYECTGYTEGCSTCGYGAEPLILWDITQPR